MLFTLIVNLFALLLWPWRAYTRRFAAAKNAVVTLTIAGTVEEITGQQRRSLLQRLQRQKPTFSLHAFRRLCEALSEDPRVRGLRLRLEPFEGGWAIAEGLREVIAGVAAKKTVWCELPKGGGLKEYFVASAASEIWLAPPASLRLVGMGGRSMYFGKAFEMAKIQIEVEQRYEFKSAGESFCRDGMSDAARAQLQTLLDEIKTQVFKAISERAAVKDLDTLLSSGPYRAEEAKQKGLIDAFGFSDALDEKIAPKKERRFIEADDYGHRRLRRFFRPWRRRAVAVVRLSGTIVDEGTLPAQSTAEQVAKILDSARQSSRVAAIVVLVDSRGGSAFGSAIIHHAIERAREKKPVVAYFADYAASGGYYAGVGCSEIVARPLTITGSIGVVAMRPVLDDLLKRFGIHRDGVTSGAHAGLLDASQRWNEAEHAAVRKEIDEVYNEFAGVVAKGRKLTPEALDAVARGRVWLGAQAATNGLVDALGGLGEALKRAAVAGKIDPRKEPVVLEPRRRFGGLPLSLLARGGVLCFESIRIL